MRTICFKNPLQGLRRPATSPATDLPLCRTATVRCGQDCVRVIRTVSLRLLADHPVELGQGQPETDVVVVVRRVVVVAIRRTAVPGVVVPAAAAIHAVGARQDTAPYRCTTVCLKFAAVEILNQVFHATEIIIERFAPVESVDDFTGSSAGMEKLDSICMQLIVIGEGLKNFDKITGNSILSKYPQVEWKKVKGLRDIISHHYVDVNAEAIYEICNNKIQPLATAIKTILEDIS